MKEENKKGMGSENIAHKHKLMDRIKALFADRRRAVFFTARIVSIALIVCIAGCGSANTNEKTDSEPTVNVSIPDENSTDETEDKNSETTDTDTESDMNTESGQDTMSVKPYSDANAEIVITNFKADKDRILINEENTITFTADIKANKDLTDVDIHVQDEDGNILGYMNDSGEDGDTTAGDHIYTLAYTLTSTDTGYDPICLVVADGIESEDRACIDSYREYTDADYDKETSARERIDKELAIYKNENGQIKPVMLDAAEDTLLNVLDALVSNGTITSYDYETGNTIATLYANGDYMFTVELWPEE